MKTVLIFDEPDKPIRYYVLPGNQKHLEGVYIGEEGNDLSYESQLRAIVERETPLDSIPIELLEAVEFGAFFIQCGVYFNDDDL